MATAALTLASTAFSVHGQMKQGQANRKAANSEASQLEMNAAQELIDGKSRGEEIQRQTARLMSDVSSIQGGQGFSGSDAQAIRQAARVAGVGKFNELATLFESKTEARSLTQAAKAVRSGGKAAQRSARLGAASTAFGGINSAFKSFNAGKGKTT